MTDSKRDQDRNRMNFSNEWEKKMAEIFWNFHSFSSVESAFDLFYLFFSFLLCVRYRPELKPKRFNVLLRLDSWTAKWMSTYIIATVILTLLNTQSTMYVIRSKSNSIFQAYANHANVLKDNDINNTPYLLFMSLWYGATDLEFRELHGFKEQHEQRYKKESYEFECQYPHFVKCAWSARVKMSSS